jgi:hypothetical protein
MESLVKKPDFAEYMMPGVPWLRSETKKEKCKSPVRSQFPATFSIVGCVLSFSGYEAVDMSLPVRERERNSVLSFVRTDVYVRMYVVSLNSTYEVRTTVHVRATRVIDGCVFFYINSLISIDTFPFTNQGEREDLRCSFHSMEHIN